MSGPTQIEVFRFFRSPDFQPMHSSPAPMVDAPFVVGIMNAMLFSLPLWALLLWAVLA